MVSHVSGGAPDGAKLAELGIGWGMLPAPGSGLTPAAVALVSSMSAPLTAGSGAGQ